jgi:type II secretory pathway pseudopilin PulG
VVKIVVKKVEASTLVEVLIAMVVIMVVFSVAIGVFSNVLSGGVSLKKIQAQAQMEVIIKQYREEGFEEDQILNIDSVDYELTTKESDIQGMLRLEISASEHGRPLSSIKCLIRSENGKGED